MNRKKTKGEMSKTYYKTHEKVFKPRVERKREK
jgi:hypothetical protein